MTTDEQERLFFTSYVLLLMTYLIFLLICVVPFDCQIFTSKGAQR